MAYIAFTCTSKTQQQTVEAGGKRPYSHRGVEGLPGLWRRACMVLAEWDSRALQRQRLALLNDRLLADVGRTREKEIVDPSELFCWLP
jgi:uncharacterized protein YjiS (DUF1127 family)